VVSFWNLFSDLLIPRLVWEPGLFLIVNALFWRNALLRWLIIACLGRSVALRHLLVKRGVVRTRVKLTCSVECDRILN